MIGLGVGADRRILHFDEIADVSARGKFRTRPQTRERADHARTVRDDAIDVAVRAHDRAGSEARVAHTAEGSDAHVVAELDILPSRMTSTSISTSLPALTCPRTSMRAGSTRRTPAVQSARAQRMR